MLSISRDTTEGTSGSGEGEGWPVMRPRISVNPGRESSARTKNAIEKIEERKYSSYSIVILRILRSII